MRRETAAAFLLAFAGASPAAFGDGPERSRMDAPALYGAACASCHGADGRGSPHWEGGAPLPDFSDCLATTSEPAEHWETIVRAGGRSRGLSSAMPAFGEALYAEEIRDLVAYLRAFCAGARDYPPGDLNFRRPLVTGKAYPEQEAVLTAALARRDGVTGAVLEATVEDRIGPRFQYELTAPFVLAPAEAGGSRGAGDLELEGKYVLFFDPARALILSAGATLVVPTGSRARGTGEGVFAVSPFLAFGKAWGGTQLQARAAADISTETDRRPSLFVYAASIAQALGPPRTAWTPGVEIVGSRSFQDGATETAAVFEISKALSPLGHIIASVGVQVPLQHSDEKYRIGAYLLWDFGDAPLWRGW